jgi:hypothetical protein
MTENDEVAVRAEIKRYSYTYSASMGGRVTADRDDDETGDAVMYEDHAAIVTALRSQLAAAESKSLAVHEVLGKERDQAITRLGEAEKLVESMRPHIRYDKSCQCSGCDGLRQLNERVTSFLSRDSAGGMKP